MIAKSERYCITILSLDKTLTMLYGPDWLKEFTQEKSIFYPVGR
jgi:hypothetical protein